MSSKCLIFLVLPVMVISCSTQKEEPFQELDCEIKKSYVNKNKRHIFKPCREYTYSAKYWDKDYNLISEEKIWMMATGKEWGYEPETQDEIAIQYRFDESKRDFIQQHSINPEFEQDWRVGIVSGVVENETETWMHPFRSNQYNFTEVASFPMVRLPLETGIQWTSNLNIYEGWGRWTNTSIENTYRVIGFESVHTEYAQLPAWHVKAIAKADFGTSVHDFWYHEDYGFVKMIIRNYAGQLLTFELMGVKQN
ncbi:MAG: hypothetical protein RIM99_01295 [Cyclobacteriaceae bacterium]